MRNIIHILALLLGSLGVYGQTGSPTLPASAVPYGTLTFLDQADSTVWVGQMGSYVKVGSWHKIDSLHNLGYTKAQVDSAIAAAEFELSEYFVSKSSAQATISAEESAVDLDDTRGTAIFSVDALATNVPWTQGVNGGFIIQSDAIEGNTRVAQIALPTFGMGWRGNMYFRNRRFDPWYRVWSSADFDINDYIPVSQRGSQNGVASLDGSGRVPFSQLPTSNPYQGTWNASTNSPTISDGSGTAGDWYRVSTAGTQNLGSGNITFSVGDDVIYNGSVWQRAPGGSSATNLSIGNRNANTTQIANSNGSNVTLPAATTSLSGLLTAGDKNNIDEAYGWGDHSTMRYIRADGQGGNTVGYSGGADELSTVVRYLNGSTNNTPGNNNGHIFSMAVSAANNAQIFIQSGTNPDFYIRTKTGGSFNAWRYVYHDGNFNPSNYVPTSRTISTGTGLSGGGNLTANRTISMASMAANTIKGRLGSSGAPQDLNAEQVRTLLDLGRTVRTAVPLTSVSIPSTFAIGSTVTATMNITSGNVEIGDVVMVSPRPSNYRAGFIVQGRVVSSNTIEISVTNASNSTTGGGSIAVDVSVVINQ